MLGEPDSLVVTEKGLQDAADILARDGFVTGEEKSVFDICDACHKWTEAFKAKNDHSGERDREAILIFMVMETFDQIRLKMN
jgi:hypothetical protein